LDEAQRIPLLEQLYRDYLVSQDSAAFIRSVSRRYLLGTLERLAEHGRRETRRAAVLALGFLGDFRSANDVLGRALQDEDRGVRLAAENGCRAVWCRDGNDEQRQRLSIVIRLNTARQFDEAIRMATELLDQAPTFAEGWNQRAIAFYSLGQYVASIADCRKALELNPYHFGAAAGMGHCYLQQGDVETALECFRQALELNPNLEGIRANVAHLERKLRRQ